MVRTQGRVDWLYGRFEVRAKLPAGQGMWPAAWLSPTNGVYGGWPSSGEIDIVELLGHDPDTIVGTVHWGASGDHKHHGAYAHSAAPYTDGYHTYAIEWEPGEIRWYVDGYLYHTSTDANGWYAPGTGSATAPFDTPFYLKLNLAVGGYWPGNPDASTPSVTEMRIDYVRVYQ